MQAQAETNHNRRFATLQPGEDALRLHLKGEWTRDNIPAIDSILKDIIARAGRRILVADTQGIKTMDTAGAWLIRKNLLANGIDVHLTDRQRRLLDVLPETITPPPVDRPKPLTAAVTAIGRRTVAVPAASFTVIAFVGRIFARMAYALLHPRSFRFPSIVRHLNDTGIKATPIIVLMAALMSMVIFYQGATQLQKFGADIFTVDLTVISLLREMGVLITAIMVAGRSGSAFAAEIGVMKLREEVDALKTIALDPVEILVLPRVIALVLALPLLTFIANMVGIVGGGIMSALILDIPITQYVARVQGVATTTMFFVGMIKAPVFGFLIAIVGTYQGLKVSSSAESVGHAATIAVVQSIALVILADALFSIIFTQAGI